MAPHDGSWQRQQPYDVAGWRQTHDHYVHKEIFLGLITA